MGEFQPHSMGSAPEASQPLLEKAKGAFGFVPNVLAVMAESPPALEAYLTLGDLLAKSAFTPAEQQLLLLTVSTANSCAYCVAAHTAGGKRAGLDAEVIEAVRSGRPIADARLEALRAFCQAVVGQRGWVSERELDAYLAAGFSKAQALEVVLAVAMKTLSNYINHFAEPPLDQPLQPMRWEKPAA